MRLRVFLAESLARRDWLGLAIMAAAVLMAGWLVALPFSRQVQQNTVDRFHLRTRPFAWWAAQQAIPPMYNLENRYWFARRPLAREELTAEPPADVETMMVNHFPVRVATFADNRLRLFHQDPEGWLYVQSVYQQTRQVTAYRIERDGQNGIRLVLQQEQP